MYTTNRYIRNGAFLGAHHARTPIMPNHQRDLRTVEQPEFISRIYAYVSGNQGVQWRDAVAECRVDMRRYRRDHLLTQLNSVGIFVYDDETERCYAGMAGWEMLAEETR